MAAAISQRAPQQPPATMAYNSQDDFPSLGGDFPSLGGTQQNGRSDITARKPDPRPESMKQPASAFGGPVPTPAFEQWCRTQLQHINGSDDIPLVYFLCSLTSQSEVAE